MAGQQHEPTGVPTSSSRAAPRPARQQAACSTAPRPELNGPFHTSHLGTLRHTDGGRYIADRGEVIGNKVAYPFIRNAVHTELLELGYCMRSHRGIRPDCTKLAALATACADAVRWWEQTRATQPTLCTMLLEICQAVSTPATGGG